MGISIRTNVQALSAQRHLFETQRSLDSSLSRLSSGLRISKAGDDAAGLAISVNLEAQIRSYNQASRNVQDGLSLVETAESAMNEQSNILGRMRELAMESANGTLGAAERGYLQQEVDALVAEIDRIAAATEFNGQALLDGTAGSLTFQVGIRDTANDFISVSMVDATATGLGVAALDISTDQATARAALATIDGAIDTLSSARADLGAAGNRFGHVLTNIQVASESLSAANSRIRDVDVGSETSNLARSQVLMQAGVSVLAQANQIPQIALRLLQ